MSTVRTILKVLGGFYLLIGILGFVPGITQMTDTGEGLLLGIFAVNAIHNIIHLLAGAALLYGAMSSDHNALSIAKVMAIVFALLVPLSIIAPVAEGVAINVPDTLLHLVTALVTGYAGFVAGRQTRRMA